MSAEVGASGKPAAKQRTVEVASLGLTLALALLLAWDNWRAGIGWEASGPKPGYFPFYVAMILALACGYGLAREIFFPPERGAPFVMRDQLLRVLQVFGPTLAFVPATQWLGLYVASFLLIAGFMRWVGRIRWTISIATSIVFSVLMFATFEIAFDVIMPKGPLEHLLGY